MAAPAPNARRAAFAPSLWQFPRRLVHPLILTFLTAALFSYLAADTVRAACLLAAGLARHGTGRALALLCPRLGRENADAAFRTP